MAAAAMDVQAVLVMEITLAATENDPWAVLPTMRLTTIMDAWMNMSEPNSHTIAHTPSPLILLRRLRS